MKTREEILELFSKAENGTLPPDFQDWDICDEDGWTIAHQAAFWGHLPDNSHCLNLKDKQGNTVADIVRLHDSINIDTKNVKL